MDNANRGIGAVLSGVRPNQVADTSQAMLDLYPTPWHIEARSRRSIIRAHNNMQVMGGVNHTKAAFIVHRVNCHAELLAELKAARECIAYCRRAHKDAQSGEGIPIEIFIDAVIARAEGP